jgi:hypothetical protein
LVAQITTPAPRMTSEALLTGTNLASISFAA